MSDWFENLFGFRELGFRDTQERLSCREPLLRSRELSRDYYVGRLTTPTLMQLREAADQTRGPRGESDGRLEVSIVEGDARELHSAPANHGAIFQVASQFNLLEMSAPDITPEDGVTRYAHDPTQGPACAMAAAPATVYRNYFVDVDGQRGQTRSRQIDCLSEIGNQLGQQDDNLWSMRNGYALCDRTQLDRVNSRLDALDASSRSHLQDQLRVGVHRDVQVTAGESNPPRQYSPSTYPRVTQVFCSALPVAYSTPDISMWESFARLILEAAYEATLYAGATNSKQNGPASHIVYLTQLGGGVFGNDEEWIHDAIRKTLQRFIDTRLDVRIVCHGRASEGLKRLVGEFG